MEKGKIMRKCFLVVAAILVMLSSVHAGTYVWSNAGLDNDWSTAANWGTEPGVGDRAVIRKAGADAAVVTQAGENCFTMDIASLTTGAVGLLKIESGDLTVNSTGVALEIGGFGSDGTIEQIGGTLDVKGYTSLGSITSTALTTGSGTYNMSGGTFSTVHFNVGLRGSGTFTQSDLNAASTVNVANATYIGRGNSGSYSISGGTMNLGTSFITSNPAMWVGYGGPGASFTQTGGTINSNGKIVIGNGTTASYTMTSGSLNFTGVNDLVLAGNSTFTYGDATATGYIGNDDAAGSTSLYVGADSSSVSEFKGWGEVDVTYVYNNGTIIADGYGTDRVLDFSDGERVFNLHNGGTSGWYAVNGGAIALPKVLFDTVLGQPTQTWGGNLYDNAPTLVNSVSITLPDEGGLARKGNFEGTLLAVDRADIPTMDDEDAELIGVWDFVLTLDPDSASTDITGSAVAIRYDDVLAGSLGLNEADLGLFQYVDGSWIELDATVNAADNVISASTDSISMFAVGVAEVPEPGTILLLTTGVAAIFRRRK